MRIVLVSSSIYACASLAACALPPQDPQQPAPPAQQPAQQQAQEAPPKWEFSGYAAAYAVPGESDYIAPVVMADRGPIHLEARYQYEDRDTASVWAGWNIEVGGDALDLTITPMVGAVFGDTEGVAPGFRLNGLYKRLDFSSEGEWLVDLEDEDDSFFYSWSEVGFTLTEWLRIGGVGQRTHIFDMGNTIDRGVLATVTFRNVAFTAYAFEPWEDDERYWVFSVGAGF